MKIAGKFLLVAGLLLVGYTFTNEAAAQTPGGASLTAVAPATAAPQRKVTYTDAFALGLIEGGTEYLPVSSIGHTIIVTHLRGLDSPELLLDKNNQPIYLTHHGVTEPLTLNRAVDMYNVMVQAGPIAAILLLFWRKVWSLMQGALGRDRAGLLLLRNLLIAFVPTGILGFLLQDWIHEHLFSTQTVAVALVGGALFILVVEHWRKTKGAATASLPGPELHELSWKQALAIGACQCVALCPGTSRSMMTIMGGYFVGLRPARAAEFSFLLGLITLTAASAHEGLLHGSKLLQGLPVGPLLFGVAIATVTAALAVKWFIGWLGRYGLGAFAWYRLALAAVIMALMWK